MKPDTIANIQQAGAWLRDAAQSLTEEVSIRQARVSEVLASDPFNAATDAHFDDWKALARLAQTVTAMEGQLRQVYLAAMGVGSDKPFGQAPLLASSPAPSAEIVDVAARKVKRSPRPRQAEAAPAAERSPGDLKGSAARAYDFIKSRVSNDGVTYVARLEIAHGASIPEGSVGFAISSLKNKGLIEQGERGLYRLA
ncbi:hypothetical protein LJR039_007263 [Pseudorhodoferax sp. LjRoot39]|uniref:hypothetical protein n=1 Tax=Pseudorhodoferax sp. LjRoot39 TaxID=3342328 RepID=UPI003ECCDF9E